ncbi:IS3 family transposase [Streptomyces sp. NPDC058239]|uniref:IS3 family transposase n=1 Tax=Streptomyces sp. NPDC058239 TaxID=3346395 RepID=UPI0036E1A7C4
MGSVGDSYDNALTENLWMLIKTEGVRGHVFATRAEANLALFEYINGFYNSRRIQERLGFLSPIEFEEKHYANQATAEQVNHSAGAVGDQIHAAAGEDLEVGDGLVDGA